MAYAESLENSYYRDEPIHLFTHGLDNTCVTPWGGPVRLWAWQFLINPLGWSCLLMDIMIIDHPLGQTCPFVDLYSLDSLLIMNPFTCWLIIFRFILNDESIHLWIYNFNSSLGMNLSTCGLNNFRSPHRMNPSTCEPNNFRLTPWWTCPLMDFNKLQGILFT